VLPVKQTDGSRRLEKATSDGPAVSLPTLGSSAAAGPPAGAVVSLGLLPDEIDNCGTS
jgi:hypothetical protein